jgi:DNA-binding GntR family transcriptional regulator
MAEWLFFYEKLRERIISGIIKSDQEISLEILKTEMKIDISQNNAMQAIDFLIAEGLIKMKNNQITAELVPARSKRNVGFMEDYLAAGRNPRIETLSIEVIPVSQVKRQARIYIPYEEDELLIRHYHVQLIDNIPYAIADSYIPHKYFERLLPKLRNTPIDLYCLMESLGYYPTKKKESLYVDMPTLLERELLQIIELMRVQVVRLDCQVWSNSTLVEICLLCDRADLYEFNYSVDMKT